MKKAMHFITVLLSVAVLSACGRGRQEIPETSDEIEHDIELTLWVFPVGNWGNPASVASLLSGFHKEYPHINVSVEFLTYENGDRKIEQAVSDGCVPDLVFEGPERLVANWGERGMMADLSDLWESEIAGEIYENIREACRHSSGEYYEFPVCMTAHCMAINYEMFEEAGALPYIDEETHTWTTEGFVKAVQALKDYGQERAGVVYCKNQGGDQGTRALVNNLYGGSFTNDAHTHYTVDSEENIRALQLLYDLEGITFEPDMTASDSIDLFCKGELAMTFCWNVSLEIQQTITNPDLHFEIFPMAFPTGGAALELQGGIWGFGVFDSGDEERIDAAKTFIRYMTEDNASYTRVVRTSTYWPVRDVENIYVNDTLMTEYSIFMRDLGDYYQITKGWTQARAAWWKMLQKVGAGENIAKAVRDFPVDDDDDMP